MRPVKGAPANDDYRILVPGSFVYIILPCPSPEPPPVTCFGVSDFSAQGILAYERRSRSPKRARQRRVSLRADADLLLQRPQITKAWGVHTAGACSRLATKSHDSMPALLRLPAKRDEPVHAW